jgi:hypothetical protein
MLVVYLFDDATASATINNNDLSRVMMICEREWESERVVR